MKNILVTGCAGFIGSNLCETLVEKGWNVIGIDNLMNGYRKNIEHLENNPNFKFIRVDIKNYEDIKNIIKDNNIKYISHQAARGSVPKSVENPILTHEINTLGTLNILWAATQNNVEKVVCASSSSIYGDSPTLPKKEDMNYNPLSPYATTKVLKEMYLNNFYNLYGLKTIGLRYFNVYGRRQDPKGDYAAVIPKWITAALKNEDLLITKEGNQTRDFTYIDDVVHANIQALENENLDVFGKSYNIAYSDKTYLKDLAEIIIKETESNSKIKLIEARKGDIKDSYADISRAQKKLNYMPKTSIRAGVKKTIQWYSQNKNN